MNLNRKEDSVSKEKPTLGEYLRAARMEAGLSMRELARRVSVDPAHLSRLENNGMKASAQLLQRIAEVLEIDSGELLEYIGVHQELPEPRAYFRRKFGINADQADVMAQLIEHYQAKNNGGGKDDTTTD
jgi:transcriptional regulator with XRE-family HTH domain